MNVNHGEKWTPEEDEFIRRNQKTLKWKEIAKKTGRTITACRRRFERIEDVYCQSVADEKWQSEARRGASDYPRLNPPSKVSLYEFCAYMAGWNDRDMGHTK